MDPYAELLGRLAPPPPPPPPKPRWMARARSLLWRHRRRAGIPLAWLVVVWVCGQVLRDHVAAGGGSWVVSAVIAAAGWVATVTVWHRARPAHVAHSTWTVGLTAAYLFAVSLGA